MPAGDIPRSFGRCPTCGACRDCGTGSMLNFNGSVCMGDPAEVRRIALALAEILGDELIRRSAEQLSQRMAKDAE